MNEKKYVRAIEYGEKCKEADARESREETDSLGEIRGAVGGI